MAKLEFSALSSKCKKIIYYTLCNMYTYILIVYFKFDFENQQRHYNFLKKKRIDGILFYLFYCKIHKMGRYFYIYFYWETVFDTKMHNVN